MVTDKQEDIETRRLPLCTQRERLTLVELLFGFGALALSLVVGYVLLGRYRLSGLLILVAIAFWSRLLVSLILVVLKRAPCVAVITPLIYLVFARDWVRSFCVREEARGWYGHDFSTYLILICVLVTTAWVALHLFKDSRWLCRAMAVIDLTILPICILRDLAEVFDRAYFLYGS